MVPTVSFKLLYALIIVRLERRVLVLVNATANPTTRWVSQQITEAFPWDEAPRYLIRDRDSIYGLVFRRRLGAVGIRGRPIAFRCPWRNAYAERLIGSIRRECLDHVVVFGEQHLRQTLSEYAGYNNTARTHLALSKDAPVSRKTTAVGVIQAHPILGGLHHLYSRVS
ncbi:MAG: integrase core domain-containing protein [Acetobacteraceae bacterium]